MVENIDLPQFLNSVQNELKLLEIPGESLAWHLQEREVEEYIPGLVGGERRKRRLTEEEWQEKLQREWHSDYALLLSQLIILEPDNLEWRKEQEEFKKYGKLTPKQIGYLWGRRQEISKHKAKQLLAKEEVRNRFCQALKTISNDSFEIAKIITPLLIGLMAAGTISIPLIPVLFAAIALSIARMSIAGLCAEKKKNGNDKIN